MDRLTDEERILAWKSNWHPSFAGIAIVEKDGTFRSVNPEFCKLLGVTPADLIEKKYQDITPPTIRDVDEKNAQMVADGLIDYYILQKTFYFPDAREVDVLLLVTRCPPSSEGDFQFFLSRIMLDEDGTLMNHQSVEKSQSLESNIQFPKPTNLVEGLLRNPIFKFWLSLGLFLGGVLAGAVMALLS